jgi:hypothetical protein
MSDAEVKTLLQRARLGVLTDYEHLVATHMLRDPKWTAYYVTLHDPLADPPPNPNV